MINIRRLPLIRSLLSLIAAAGASLLLGGCWDRVEVNDLAIVTAAGFDIADNNQIRLSAQIYVPAGTSGSSSSSESIGGESGGSSGGSSGGAQVFIKSAIGMNTADAASKLQILLSRRLFWGQADSFIFGEALARQGLKDPLDFLIRQPQPRERANLYVSRGDAHNLLDWQPIIERNSSELLREMSNLRTGVNTTLLESVIQLTEEGHTALLPWITLKTVEKEKPTLYVDGSVSIKELKMNRRFNMLETRGLMWLLNEVDKTTMSVKVPDQDGVASLRLLRSRTRLKPAVRNGEWRMRVQVRAEGNIDENSTTVDVSSSEKLKEFEKLFEQELEKRVSTTIQSAQRSRTDVVGFAEQFHRHYPRLWKARKEEWDALFPTVQIDYDVKVKILRTGLIGRDEVLKFAEEEQ